MTHLISPQCPVTWLPYCLEAYGSLRYRIGIKVLLFSHGVKTEANRDGNMTEIRDSNDELQVASACVSAGIWQVLIITLERFVFVFVVDFFVFEHILEKDSGSCVLRMTRLKTQTTFRVL